MTYLLIYNDNTKSCLIGDRKTLLDFAKYMTTKDKYPVCGLVTVKKKS
jgi:hypothetical protein